MSYNSEHFPSNIFEPKTVEVNNDEITLYRAKFSSLFSLYNYLKGEPLINHNIFKKLSSEINGYDFAGKPYEEALEDLILEHPDDYELFLNFQKELKNCDNSISNRYVNTKSVCGGSIDMPSFCAGSPLCFNSQKYIEEPKFIKINMPLQYSCSTSKEAVFNRSIILSNIITALERNGYYVGLNAFELSHVNNEYVLIEIKLKNFNEKTNIKNIYKTTCRVEFLRRILFRVLETMDVTGEYWNMSYGSPCNKKEVTEILKLDNKKSIYFGQPIELEITGRDLCYDFEKVLFNLELEDKINVNDTMEKIKENQKKLKLK